MADERRASIVDAYVQLIAERGTAEVPMGEIAERARVARTAISHFVGDRASLRVATIQELGRRYEVAIRDAIGPNPTPENMIDVLFSPMWTTSRSAEDRAFDILQATAHRDSDGRDAVRGTYALLVDELANAITRHSSISRQRAMALAYGIVCLSETNTVLLDVGFPERHGHDAATLARSILRAG